MDEEKTTQEQETEAQPEAAENMNTSGNETQETVQQPVQELVKNDPAPEKTFTQAEVDDIVRKRLARASKDSQVTAAENAALRSSIACFKAGVRAECIEDAVALASKYVDDKTDFDAALAKVLEKYPAFGGTVQAVKNSSPDMTPKKTEKSDAGLRAAMGLK